MLEEQWDSHRSSLIDLTLRNHPLERYYTYNAVISTNLKPSNKTLSALEVSITVDEQFIVDRRTHRELPSNPQL